MNRGGSQSGEQSYQEETPLCTETEAVNSPSECRTSFSGYGDSPSPCTSSGVSAPPSTPPPSTSGSANDAATNSKVGREKSRKRKRESFEWLYKDLSFVDEYNMGTVDGDDLYGEDDERTRKQEPIPKHTTPKPTQPAGAKLPSLPYAEFHFRQTFLNYSATKRKVRTRSYIVYWEPTEVYVTDLSINTHIEDDNATESERQEVCVQDESHLPLKKRRFLNLVLESLSIKPEEGLADDKGNLSSPLDSDETVQSYLPLKKRKRFRNSENWEIFDKKVVTESNLCFVRHDLETYLPFKKRQRFLKPINDAQDVKENIFNENYLPFKKRRRFMNPENEIIEQL